MRPTLRVAALTALLLAVAASTAALALPPYRQPPSNPGLVAYPNPALPASTTPGGSFRLVATAEVAGVEAVGAFYRPGEGIVVERLPLTLEPLGGGYEYLVHVPENASTGVYDLNVTLSDGSVVPVPRGLWVHSPDMDRLLFIHMSDLHFGAGDASYKLTSYLLAQLLGADLIFNTGDEADTAAASEYAQAMAYRYTFAFTVPMVLVPGNHDHPIDNFLRLYGNMSTFCWQGLPWLVATGGYTDEVGYLTDSQLDAVEQCLEGHPNATVKLILFHHPVFYWQGEVHLPPSYPFRNPKEDRGSPLSYYWGGKALEGGELQRLLQIVVDYNVTFVLSGHIHRDQYVLYQPPGSGPHYFITTTTSGHSMARPNYNGIQAVLVYRNGTVEFPYAPPSFIGFENGSRSRVYNSIPVDPNPARAPSNYGFIHAFLYPGPHAYVLNITNRYAYPIPPRVILLALPQAGVASYLNASEAGGAQVEVLDIANATLPAGSYTLVALNVSLPQDSSFQLILAGAPDTQPPTARLGILIPRHPTAGKAFRAYIKFDDDVTGVRNFTVRAVADNGAEVPVTLVTPLESVPGDAQVKVGPTPTEASTVTLIVHAEDYAGHSAEYNLTVSLYGSRTATTSTSTTAATTTQQASTSSTAATGQQATSQQAAAPTATASGGSSTTPSGGGLSAASLAAVVVAVVVVAAAALLLSRR